jgi:hypothetical protein
VYRRHNFDGNSRVRRVPGFGYDSVEPGVFVSGIVNCSGGAVGFNQLVVTFNFVAYTFLSLLLDVMSVFVSDAIFEFVLGGSLQRNTEFK